MVRTSASIREEALNLSIVIITYNEEHNLTRCLASLPVGSEIIVVDSGSQDNTVAIAKEFKARVFERAFTDFAEQRNFGLSQASRHWILSIDADEVLSSDLKEWVVSTCSQNTVYQQQAAIAYRLRRGLIFMGRKMRWGKTQDAPIRLFQRGKAKFEGSIHEKLNVKPEAVQLAPKGRIWHYSYKDLSDYFNRFNRYTSAIAERQIKAGYQPSMLSHVLRPWFEFIVRYFFRLGFLDGYPGYTYALNSSLYAYIKYAKVVEARLVGGIRLSNESGSCL